MRASGRSDAFANPSRNDRCLRQGDVSNRRIADVADRALGRLNWADNDRSANGRKRADRRRSTRPIRFIRDLFYRDPGQFRLQNRNDEAQSMGSGGRRHISETHLG